MAALSVCRLLYFHFQRQTTYIVGIQSLHSFVLEMPCAQIANYKLCENNHKCKTAEHVSNICHTVFRQFIAPFSDYRTSFPTQFGFVLRNLHKYPCAWNLKTINCGDLWHTIQCKCYTLQHGHQQKNMTSTWQTNGWAPASAKSWTGWNGFCNRMRERDSVLRCWRFRIGPSSQVLDDCHIVHWHAELADTRGQQ